MSKLIFVACLLWFVCFAKAEEQAPLDVSRYSLCMNECSHQNNRALAGVCNFNCKQRFMKRTPDRETKYSDCILFCAKYSDVNSSYSADCRKHCENIYPKDIVL